MSERRTHIAKEVLSTERTFVKQLKCIVDVFLIPLKVAIQDRRPILKERNIEQIFSNIEEILRVNVQLLFLVEQRLEQWNENPCLGDIFNEVLPEFGVYDKYLMDHHKAIVKVAELDKKGPFAQFLINAKTRPECMGLDFLALLITPVQRILRYKLLLEDLIKHTPNDHPDHVDLVMALGTILKKAAAVNESIRIAENFEKLCQIQRSFITGNVKNLVDETRLFIREGNLTKVCRKIPKKRWFFLFSDILIYASVVAQPNDRNLYSFHRLVQLAKTSVKPLPDTPTLKNAFQIITNDKSFTVFADTPEEKEFWLQDFMNSKTDTTNRSSAPVWDPDSAAGICKLCHNSFTFLNRRHHCRQCGGLVCGTCSTGRTILSHTTDFKAARVCDKCLPPPVTGLPISNPVLHSSSVMLTSPPVLASSPPAATSPPRESVLMSAEDVDEAAKKRSLAEGAIVGTNSARQNMLSQLVRESSMSGLSRQQSVRTTTKHHASPLPPTPGSAPGTDGPASPLSLEGTPTTPVLPPKPQKPVPPLPATASPRRDVRGTTAPAATTTGGSPPSANITPISTPTATAPPPTPFSPVIPPIADGPTTTAPTLVFSPSQTKETAPSLPPKPKVDIRGSVAPNTVERVRTPSPTHVSPTSIEDLRAIEAEMQSMVAGLYKMFKTEHNESLPLLDRLRVMNKKIQDHNNKYNTASTPTTPTTPSPATTPIATTGSSKSFNASIKSTTPNGTAANGVNGVNGHTNGKVGLPIQAPRISVIKPVELPSGTMA